MKNFSVTHLKNRPFTQKKLQLNQLKYKQLLPHNHFATLTYDNQIKSVHFRAERDSVLPSQKDDCHPIPADFGHHQFTICFIDERDFF